MNFILGIVLLFLNGEPTEKAMVGRFASLEECQAANDAVAAEALLRGAAVKTICIDTAQME